MMGLVVLSAGFHALMFAVMLPGKSDHPHLIPQLMIIPLTIEPRPGAPLSRRQISSKVDSAWRSSGDDVSSPPGGVAPAPVVDPPLALAGAPETKTTEDALRDRIARSLRSRVSGCSAVRFDDEERLACEMRLAATADRARPISGSGDQQRDREFARQGAAALAAYERRRAPLNANDEVTCVAIGPVEDCARVEVELYSSSRGILPNQRRQPRR